MQKTSENYTIVLTPDMMEALQLVEGSTVEVRAVAADEQGVAVEYVSEREALDLYERSKARFGQAYEALAK